MVKYSIEAIASLLKPVQTTPGQPLFGTLYQMQQAIIDVLCILSHPDYYDNGLSGYMMALRAFHLFNMAKAWLDPHDVGDYFVTPALATSGAQICVA